MTPDLSGLHDIHLPAPITWWPPAPGWWGLLALAAALAVLGLRLAARRRRDRWRAVALAELVRLRRRLHAGELDPSALVRQLSILLRRVALTRFPRPEVAGLHGEAWLAFLDETLGGAEFRRGVGQVLATGPYAAVVESDPEPLLALAERWVRALPRESRRPDRRIGSRSRTGAAARNSEEPGNSKAPIASGRSHGPSDRRSPGRSRGPSDVLSQEGR